MMNAKCLEWHLAHRCLGNVCDVSSAKRGNSQEFKKTPTSICLGHRVPSTSLIHKEKDHDIGDETLCGWLT